MNKMFYSVNETAEILNLHPKTVIRFIHNGQINAKKIGRAWMITHDEIKAFAHGELAVTSDHDTFKSNEGIESRLSVSAVVEIRDENAEDASRISNSMMAMLNSSDGSLGKTRFDFIYNPETHSAKYVFWGSPSFISMVLKSFEILVQEKRP